MIDVSKLRGIPFRPEMLDALDRGIKTQTRRVAKPWPPKVRLLRTVSGDIPFEDRLTAEPGVYDTAANANGALSVIIRHGAINHLLGIRPGEFEFVKAYRVGEILYVKEALKRDANAKAVYSNDESPAGVAYYESPRPWCWQNKTLPAIFMPKWAARRFIRITNVRWARTQNISRADVLAEGVTFPVHEENGKRSLLIPLGGDDSPLNFLPDGKSLSECTADEMAKAFWASLIVRVRGLKGWQVNPWQFVYDFEQVRDE